jgi:hypothetical protein
MWSMWNRGIKMTLFSVDPGMTGAILFRTGQSWLPVRMPALKVRTGKKSYRSELDVNALAEILKPMANGQAAVSGANLANSPETHSPRGSGSIRKVSGLLEKQSPHRGQGFFGNASIMQSYGVLLGILHALSVPFATIDPQSWRRSLRLAPGKERSWLLLGKECPELASMVKSWPQESRVAVADCYCMHVAGERLGMLPAPAPDPDWLA